ncbi:unnamed protein product [Meloidogyne enterolobii]|uniref:Uncharacterized protein n=1 Tax=Meloidogyne enterolobii TaxID=390850 RepID=A0ACB1A8B0_MELEN
MNASGLKIVGRNRLMRSTQRPCRPKLRLCRTLKSFLEVLRHLRRITTTRCANGLKKLYSK